MTRKPLAILLLALVTPLLVLAADPPWIARSSTGMVAADSAEASQVGADLLAAGGNAFDAAIATSLALAVARPQSTGLGGGGFMLAYVAKERRVVVLDFREVAPAACNADLYALLAQQAGDGPSPTVYGGAAIGVPGQAAGLAEIRKRYGTRDWPELAAGAIKLTETGFAADEHYVNACQEVLKDMEKWPKLRKEHEHLYESLLGKGTPPRIGDKVTRPELTPALKLLARDGPGVFRKGRIADEIVKAARAAGSPITAEDLAEYAVREREPLRLTRNGLEIVTMPPPSSGGICLLETLNLLDTQKHVDGPALVTALKHAFADRARWLGDPESCSIPVARLISTDYAKELIGKAAKASDEFGSAPPPDDGGTSHFCVADHDGNVVAMTETVNGFFGSLVMTKPYGIILNNQMDDFATQPGKPNLYGLIQSERNAVAPGKRPLSSMVPTLVLKDGKPVLAIGASGGPRIITSVLQVLVHVIDEHLSLEEAQNAVRLHHQWLPDEVSFDKDPPPELVQALEAAGCKIKAKRNTGNVQAIQFLDDGTMVGASDPRKGGRPAGVN